jgi:hypothetical protein
MDRTLHRRSFIAGSLGIAGMIALPRLSAAAEATPEAASDYPTLEIALTDDGFEIEEPLKAGRFNITVSNIGTSTDSHFGLGKIPDTVTDAQYQEWIDGQGNDTDALSFDDIEFVGVPDWPQPGGYVSGVIDISPGRYFLFDPFDARGYRLLNAEGELTTGADPAADLTVELREMEFVFPESAFTTKPVRWKIENRGAMSHEIAVLPVSPDFTEEVLQLLLSLPEEATPPPGTPEFVYQPVAAIGILAKQHASWLDVQLELGHYLAACMLPFGTGYPHAMDGMYRFFEVM